MLIEDDPEKIVALSAFTEKLLPGRWEDARGPNRKELKATSIVAIDIESASAKIRIGPPGDFEEDYALPHWAGVLPMSQVYGTPVADDLLQEGIELPDYVKSIVKP